MSGIIGIYRFDNKIIDSSEPHRMIDRLAHRGPDGSGTWHRGPVGLGHCMLWTTPESLHEQLPLVSDDDRCAITADARIDNRDELITGLRLVTPPAEITDSQLILHAYERWGEHCVDHLLGDFAFAIWDDDKQHLFCARDHMGVKPFFHYCSDTLFAFASEIKALFCLPQVPREINEVRVACYLAAIMKDKQITAYKDVRRLPAAYSMVITSEQADVRQYWSLDPTREIRLDSDDAYAAAFRDIFSEAVRCRLRSAFPVGAELSGGLDSSSVACVARQHFVGGGGPPLPVFSLTFDATPECDESAYANALVAQGRVVPHWIPTGALSPFKAVLKIVSQQNEELTAAPNLYLSHASADMAQRAGIRVLLTGLDGDTTVYHAPEYFLELARTGRWKTLAENVYEFSKLRADLTTWKVFKMGVLAPIAPGPFLQVWHLVRRQHAPVHVNAEYINPTFARRVGLAALQEAHKKMLKPDKTVREGHYQSLTSDYIELALEEKDRISAPFGIELRHPFFDKRLVEFCLALPAEQKMRGGWTRVVLRHAMDKLLPREIQWRPSKSNLGPGFVRNLATHDGPLIETVLTNPPYDLGQFVDVSKLRRVFERFKCHPTTGDAMVLWRAVNVALWISVSPAQSPTE